MKQTSKEWLEDIETTIAQPKPKKAVGWYCLSTKVMVNTIAFATHSKPNFIKRFFMRTLLDFYWVKEEQTMTNNKQQTAVEWLFNEFERIDKVYYRNTIIYTDARKEAYEKAKEMEKQRIETAYNKGTVHGIDYPESTLPLTGEQYYEQTYGDDKQ
jgi:hypothetical protein